MSTRACIARATNATSTEWYGVYSHADGHPSGLGARIWETIHDDCFLMAEFSEEIQLNLFCEAFITKHKGGWKSFPDECYCHDRYAPIDGVRSMVITDKTTSPLFIDWVYVLHSARHTLTILASTNQGEAYKYKRVATIDLLGEEPNWEALERSIPTINKPGRH